jgi:hypothetical protein
MWNVETNVIPTIAWASVAISKLFRKYLNNVPGKHEIKKYTKQPLWVRHTNFGKY